MIRRLALAALLLGVLGVSGCDSPGAFPPTAPPNGSTGGGTGSGPGTLVWSDEFGGSAGTPPDPSKWTYDIGTDWGNSQLEFDTSRPSNVSLDGQGRLAITARVEPYQGRSYTSGRINTRGLFDQTKGRFEARIQLPIGRGLWPAFWLLGSDVGTTGWPGCGEIDIMEYRGQEPARVHGSLHGPGYSGGGALTRAFTLANGRFSDGFHVFAVEWRTNEIRYLVDDVVYQTITPANLPPNGRWVFDHPFTVLLNLAVGGNYVGPPDITTTFPQTMLVDYVRVYSLP